MAWSRKIFPYTILLRISGRRNPTCLSFTDIQIIRDNLWLQATTEK